MRVRFWSAQDVSVFAISAMPGVYSRLDPTMKKPEVTDSS